MKQEAQYLRDLVPRALRDAVATLEGPAPSNDVQRSYREQHPPPVRKTPAKAAEHFTRANFPLEHNSWKISRRRCTSEADPSWRYYGALGIKFHAPWAEPDVGFARFMQDVGPRPTPKHVLSRKNKNGNYEPGNVAWKKRSDIRMGVRSDRKYDEPPPVRSVTVQGDRRDATSQVVISERGGVITLGDLKLGPNQADEVALCLIRMAAELRSRRLK